MERQADKLPRSEVAAHRAAFWADKESNFASIGHAKPGKLEIEAANSRAALSMGVAAWQARYDAACQPLRLIQGGKA